MTGRRLRAVALRMTLCMVMGTGLMAQRAALADTCLVPEHKDIYTWRCAHKYLDMRKPGSAQAAVWPLVVARKDGLWIVDPGPSEKVGSALAHDVFLKFGDQPVQLLDSRAHPEHVLANDGFVRTWAKRGAHKVSVRAPALTAELMRQRCLECLRRLSRDLGLAAMKGTRIRLPAPAELRLPGARMIDARNALIEQDTLWIADDHRWAWVGALAAPDRLPDLDQGQWPARRALLVGVLEGTSAQTLYLSSFGHVKRAQLQAQLDYFDGVSARVKAMLEEGKDALSILDELKSAAPWPVKLNERDAAVHALNVQRLVRQQEEGLFDGR